MTTIDILIAIATLIALVAVVGIRTWSGNQIEVRLNDALIAVIVAAVLLFMSGRIGEFALGTQGLTVKAAIITASTRKIDQQVAALPVVEVKMEEKGATSDIPNVVRRQIPALDFVLGSNRYAPDATRQYLETLINYPFFRFVVFLNKDKSVFGMIDARKLSALLHDQGSGLSFQDFSMLVNRGEAPEQARIKALPGFVPASDAVKRTTEKRGVLERMEKLGADWLPVLKDDGSFDGVVDRSRLTASLILDVANALGGAAPATK
jgi:hypothetical protein